MDILENGLDSFSKSIGLLKKLHDKENELFYEFMLKDIVINLHHSTETLFKYLITKKNQYLVYSDLEKYFRYSKDNKYKSTNKRYHIETINYLDSIHRVMILYDIKIKEEEYKRLKLLNDIRNGLAHYQFEFEGGLAEHTIALVLPTLFKIYSNNIDEFKQVAEDKHFYTDIKGTFRHIEIWNVNRWLILDEKVKKASARIKYLHDNPKEIEKIMKENQHEIEYTNCFICQYKKFKANGNLLLTSENIDITGECECCGIHIEKEDAYFINLNFPSYINFLKWSRSFGIDSIKNILSSTTSLKETYGDEYHVLKENLESNLLKLRELVIYILQRTVADLNDLLAEKYFYEAVYPYNDEVEEIVEKNNSFIELTNKSLYDKYEGDEAMLRNFSDIKKILDNYCSITDDNEEEIYEILKTFDYTESYYNAIYKNWDGDEIESEVTIRVHADFNDFYTRLKHEPTI